MRASVRRTLVGIITSLAAVQGVSAGTLEEVRDRGVLNCGVDGDLLGFSKKIDGRYQGIDADICYAIAAAIFDDPEKVKFVLMNPNERFDLLRNGEIDVLSRNTTHTLSRDAAGINFTYYNYIDSQGIMTRKDSGVGKATDLKDVDVCVQKSTTTELNLKDFFQQNKIKYRLITIDTTNQTRQDFFDGRCDAVSTDKSQLAAMLVEFGAAHREDFVILPDDLSKEPLGPVVRENDDQWMDIVRWTIFALINADELGVTSTNLGEVIETTDDAEKRRLLGLEGDMGELLGLSNDWVVNMLEHVGNYDEIYQRNITDQLGLKREGSLNASPKDGGILYAPPIR